MSDGMSRRAFLRGAAGATALGAGAGTAAGQEGTGTATGTGTGGATGTGNATGTAAGTGTGNATGNASATGTAGGDGGGGGSVADCIVGPGGEYVYRPGTGDTMYVTPGTTVNWQWASDNHNIVPDSQPDGADWEGHTEIANEGATYSYTFETLGTYEYYCQPHESQGMAATLEVVESTPTASPVPQGPPEVPDAAKSLGVASFIAMCATLGLAFFFQKYGGNYEPPEDE